MCGINGALSFEGSEFRIAREYIEAMRDTMAHRGPDGAGAWVSTDGRIGLGHRRLSIIDTAESANQPMANHDGSVQIVFNGEIYNHVSLRRELAATGRYTWRTDHSDTEVILHGFEEWGIECVQRLRGMFSIAIWDARRAELWLIRDRIGIKPLYYSVHDRRVVFASEIKALLTDPDQQRQIDERAFFHYLSFLTTPAPQTLFRGICKLPPGTWIRFSSSGESAQSRYWDVWNHTQPQLGRGDDEIAEGVLHKLRESVALHAVSDVPVGVFLSGGIDSSTNAALFNETAAGPVQTFTVGYADEHRTYTNEFVPARLMAASIGAHHHERVLELDECLAFIPEMVRMQDEPLADPVCIPLHFVSRLAREAGIKVCQVGEGADELFWGYPAWKTLLSVQRWCDLAGPAWFKHAAAGALRLAGRASSKEYELLRRAARAEPVFWSGAEGFTDVQKHALLSERLRHDLAGASSWEVLEPLRVRYDRGAWERSHLNWMSYADLNLRLPELLLMRVDKMGMGAGLEARVPFLDHEFVELAMSIPQRVKTRGSNLKYLLKRAVKGLIPDELINRRKQGFGAPVHEWYLGRLGESARRELTTFCRESDLLDKDALDDLLRGARGAKIWCLLNVALWWREYIA